MELVLWRHAEAVDHPLLSQGQQGDTLDLQRGLTPRGEKHAARMGAWLDRQLPEQARIYVSPALRTQQTAEALGRKFKVRQDLAPGADHKDLLLLANWPHGKSPLVLVGHQPTLGRLIANLLHLPDQDWPVKKGALWWLRYQEKSHPSFTKIVTVQTPEHL